MDDDDEGGFRYPNNYSYMAVFQSNNHTFM